MGSPDAYHNLGLTPSKPVELKILLDGSICEVYADSKIAMSARLYNHYSGDWGPFVSEGIAYFRNFKLMTL
jgi:beta-fructofuranosidase